MSRSSIIFSVIRSLYVAVFCFIIYLMWLLNVAKQGHCLCFDAVFLITRPLTLSWEEWHSRCLTWGSSQRCSTQSPRPPEFLHTCDFHSSGDSPSRAKYRPSPLSFLLKCGCFSGLGHKPQLERTTESTQSYFLWMILTRHCRFIDCTVICRHSVMLYCQTLFKPNSEEQWSVLFEYSLYKNIL